MKNGEWELRLYHGNRKLFACRIGPGMVAVPCMDRHSAVDGVAYNGFSGLKAANSLLVAAFA